MAEERTKLAAQADVHLPLLADYQARLGLGGAAGLKCPIWRRKTWLKKNRVNYQVIDFSIDLRANRQILHKKDDNSSTNSDDPGGPGASSPVFASRVTCAWPRRCGVDQCGSKNTKNL